MKKIDRYIGKVLIQSILTVFIAFVGLQLFLSFVNEMKDIGHGDYTFANAVSYVLLELPGQLYQMFPMVGLMGCLLGLGQLASNREIVIMRASGMSRGRIFASSFLSMLLIMAVMFMIGEGIAPFASHRAESLKAIATAQGQAIQTKQGLWVRVKYTFLHVNKVLGGGRLQGVDRYQFDKSHRLQKSSHARFGSFKNGRWELFDVNTTMFAPDHLQTDHQDHEIWHANLNPTLLGLGEKAPSELDLKSLHEYMRYLRYNGLSETRFALNMWQRLLMPLSILIMMLLAVPFVFGPLRDTSMGLRMLMGLASGFAFYIANQFFAPLAEVYQMPVLLAAVLPTMIFAGMGGILWWRTA